MADETSKGRGNSPGSRANLLRGDKAMKAAAEDKQAAREAKATEPVTRQWIEQRLRLMAEDAGQGGATAAIGSLKLLLEMFPAPTSEPDRPPVSVVAWVNGEYEREMIRLKATRCEACKQWIEPPIDEPTASGTGGE